jgi:hypothetical protein
MYPNCELEYSSFPWNSVTSAETNNQEKFTDICFNRDFTYTLEQLKLHNLRKRSYHLDLSFIIQFCPGSQFCSLLEIADFRVPTRYMRDFSMFIFVSAS